MFVAKRSTEKAQWKKILRKAYPAAFRDALMLGEVPSILDGPRRRVDAVISDMMAIVHAFPFNNMALDRIEMGAVRENTPLIKLGDFGAFMVRMVVPMVRTAPLVILAFDRYPLMPQFKTPEQKKRGDGDETEEMDIVQRNNAAELAEAIAALRACDMEAQCPRWELLMGNRELRGALYYFFVQYMLLPETETAQIFRAAARGEQTINIVVDGYCSDGNLGEVTEPPLMLNITHDSFTTTRLPWLWHSHGEGDKGILWYLRHLKGATTVVHTIDTDMLWDAKRCFEELVRAPPDLPPHDWDVRACQPSEETHVPPWDVEKLPLSFVLNVCEKMKAEAQECTEEHTQAALFPFEAARGARSGEVTEIVVCFVDRSRAVHAMTFVNMRRLPPRMAELHAVALASGCDFTNGYHGLTPERFYTAWVRHGKGAIGELLYRGAETRYYWRVDPDAYERLVYAAYYEKWVRGVAKRMEALGGREFAPPKSLECAGEEETEFLLKIIAHGARELRKSMASLAKGKNGVADRMKIMSFEGQRVDMSLVYVQNAVYQEQSPIFFVPDPRMNGFVVDEEGTLRMGGDCS